MRKFELENANPIQIMAQAVSEVSGVDLADILAAKVGEQWSEDQQLDGGIRSFYGWYVNALSNYKGKGRTAQNFGFEYGDEYYRIPYIVAAELAGGLPILPDVETSEAVEAFETIRGFNQQIKDAGDPKGERRKRITQLKEAIVKQGDSAGDMARELRKLEAEIDTDGDPNGNLLFAQYLRMIAILARKEGEKLPTNDGDRERWIQGRMIHLQGIDTATALDVDFFFERFIDALKKDASCHYFFNPPAFRARSSDTKQAAAEREAYNRAVSHQKEVQKRIGWRSIIHTLLERGWFNQPGMTPMESALRSKFEDAVRAISRENAML